MNFLKNQINNHIRAYYFNDHLVTYIKKKIIMLKIKKISQHFQNIKTLIEHL